MKSCNTNGPLRGTQGIALPIALLGLILVSIMVTSLLLTSATEVALSGAHQDATASLYAAESALEGYVAQQGVALAATGGPVQFASAAGTAANLTVQEVARMGMPSGMPDRRVYRVRAEPVTGGRAVAAGIEIGPFIGDINSAATFGGNSKIGGSSIVSNGSDSLNVSCTDSTVQNAIVHADSTEVDITGNQVSIIGGTTESELGRDELIRKTLGGYSIREFAEMIHKRELPADKYVTFGSNPIWGSSPGWNNDSKPNSLAGTAPASLTGGVNWHCPGKMETSKNCWNVAGIDTTLQKVVVIDASNFSKNDPVKLQGDHGQGLLIVLNGGLQITGGFIFRGIMLSEGDIDLSGTGNKVEGAMISKNDVSVVRDSDVDSNVMGNAVVRYNKCAINNVLGTINPVGGDPFIQRTSAWREIIR